VLVDLREDLLMCTVHPVIQILDEHRVLDLLLRLLILNAQLLDLLVNLGVGFLDHVTPQLLLVFELVLQLREVVVQEHQWDQVVLCDLHLFELFVRQQCRLLNKISLFHLQK